MFFFEWVTIAPAAKKPRKAPMSDKSELPLYLPEGRYRRKQQVIHPTYGPGTVTLVRMETVVILFKSDEQDPPRLELCGIPVKGRRFRIAPKLSLEERVKANGGTTAYLQARGRANLSAQLLRKWKKELMGLSLWWVPMVHPVSPLGSPRWPHSQPEPHRRTLVLHGLIPRWAA